MLIAGFLETSFVDWRGKVVATVFTYGCNFRCPFCHNYTLVTEKKKRFIPMEKVIEWVEYLKDWIDGVCITGGEPTIHLDLTEFIKEVTKITEVKVDTNGTNPEILRELIPHVSYVAMDIKAPKNRYEELAGARVNMEKIEESIEIIKRYARDYEFRTTAVPTLGMKDFEQIASWLHGAKRYVIQQYSTKGGTLEPEYLKLRPMREETLHKICMKIRHHFRQCRVVNL